MYTHPHTTQTHTQAHIQTHTCTHTYVHTHPNAHTHTRTHPTHSHTTDFYEEMLALLDLFTTVSVSQQMWPMLDILYETFTRDGFDYFTGTQVK